MSPVINPIYPIDGIHSVEELMSIAVGMEHEAAERYTQLAEAMEQRGENGLAATFLQLAAMEREHEAGIGRWASREGRPAPEPAAFAWRLPETFDDEDTWLRALTPYVALGVAVRNEERAFVFYSYLAALAPDEATRTRAESLAREELKHVAQLRALRRLAYRRERAPAPAPRPASSRAELEGVAAGLRHGADLLDRLTAEALDAEGDHHAAALLRHGLGGADPGTRAPASPAVQAAQAAGLLRPGTLTADGALRLALRDAEEAAEIFMTTAEHAADEDLLHAAQERAERAIARLAVVRTLIHDRERREHP